MNIYQAAIRDRLTGEVVYLSRPCSTWGEAQRRAEMQCRRQYAGDRYAIINPYTEGKSGAKSSYLFHLTTGNNAL